MDVHEMAARIAVRDLIDEYHAAVNGRDWSLLSQLFTRDATWEALSPVDLRFETRDGIMSGLIASVGRQELLVQACSGVVVECESPDRASVRSTLIEFGRESGTCTSWFAVAFYVDKVRKEEDRWRFERRTLHVRYIGELPAPAEQFNAQNLLAQQLI